MIAWFSLLVNTVRLEVMYWTTPLGALNADELMRDEMRSVANAGWFKLFQWVRGR